MTRTCGFIGPGRLGLRYFSGIKGVIVASVHPLFERAKTERERLHLHTSLAPVPFSISVKLPSVSAYCWSSALVLTRGQSE